MPDNAPDADADEIEFVWAANDNKDIVPAQVPKAALDPNVEGGMASRGWHEIDAAKARALLDKAEAANPPAPAPSSSDKK